MRILFLLLMTIASTALVAQANYYQSPVQPAAIIELYTSEGCSSCPPAERWINRFAEQEGLWRDYFPIAWHVDYWDSLGWPDRFANADYSQRQRRYQRQTPLRSVYTPGVLVNGEAWRGWVRGDQPPRLQQLSDMGVLTVNVSSMAVKASLHHVAEASTQSTYLLQVAVLGFDLTTKVKRGENAGRQLNHEFVVLANKTYGRSTASWQGDLPTLPDEAKHAGRLAVVFWLEAPDSPVPKQIAGGWLQL